MIPSKQQQPLNQNIYFPLTEDEQPYLHNDFIPFIDGIIINHADNGHAQVASDAKADAETQTAEDGNDVTAREAKAGAVYDGLGLLRHFNRPPLFCQLDGLPTRLLPF